MTVDIEKARAQVEELRLMYAHPLIRKIGHAAADTIATLLDEVAKLTDVLHSNGFVRCDISACNCGSWHARYGLRERFEEIKDALSEATDLNGKTVLSALNEVIAERDALARDAARFDWYFGATGKGNAFMVEYMRGIREGWTPDQWRAAIDAAMNGASDEP